MNYGLNFQKTKIMASCPITSWQIDGEKNGNSGRFYFIGLQNHCGGVCSHEIKWYLLLGRKAMTNLDSILKHRDITLPTNVHILSSITPSCPTHCDPMDCSTPGVSVHYQLLEFTQTHVHWVGDAIQPSHPLSSPSPTAFNLSQHQGLFQWASSSHQVAKVLELYIAVLDCCFNQRWLHYFK